MSSKVRVATFVVLSTLIRRDTPPIAEDDVKHNGSEYLIVALGGQHILVYLTPTNFLFNV